MGTVSRLRSKYSGPNHPWEAARIEEERLLTKEYGLKNKKEIWKATSKLRKIKSQAKLLIAATSEQSKKEEILLIKKLVNLGILKEGSALDNILEIDARKILNRRLQSIVLAKGLARTSKQARQMITHGHITVKGNKTNVPGYLVPTKEESQIKYSETSQFNDKEHPEINIKSKDEAKKVNVVAVPPKEKHHEARKQEVQEAVN